MTRSSRTSRGSTRSRIVKQFMRWKQQMRKLFGLRSGIKVDGVYYRELTAEQLGRALSRKGSGYKDYRVTFPDGRKQVIRCTPSRVYADVMGAAMLPRYRMVESAVLPGMRALDARGGTGYGAAWLSRLVGPSGAVVMFEPDEESVEFAASRYPIEHLAIERGTFQALAGETDGSFEAVVRLGASDDDTPSPAEIAELWRVVAPGGVMMLGLPRNSAGKLSAGGDVITSALVPTPTFEAVEESGLWVDVLVRKPEEDE